MATLSIDKVKTGKGLAGSRIALIFAPPGSPPGSLATLTRFFNEQPHLRAMPGYHGPQRNHVLRVSGLKHDSELLDLLQQSFPKWQEEHMQGLGVQAPITVADELRTEPIGEVDHFPFHSGAQRFIKENANTLTGLSYLAGSFGLFLSGYRKQMNMKGVPNQDWYRIYSSAAYFLSSCVLVAFAQKTDNPRDIYTIMESIYPKLKDANSDERQQMYEHTSKTLSLVRQYPWELFSLINISGAASHMVSARKRRFRGELAAATGTFVSSLITLLVPEQGGRSIINDFVTEDDKTMVERLEDMQKHYPSFAPFIKQAERITEKLTEQPLAASALIQSISNVGYGVAALSRTPKNWQLASMSGAFLSGNYMQSQSTKGRGPGFDDVVTAASNIIRSDPKTQGMSHAELDRRIEVLADALSAEKEIVHTKSRLTKGIHERLKRKRLNGHVAGEDTLLGFIPSEKHILKESPFVSPHLVEATIPSPDGAENAAATGV